MPNMFPPAAVNGCPRPRRIPIGNTIAARWTVNVNGQATLEGRDLTLVMTDPKGFTHPMVFQITGNVITFVYEGYLQRHLGIYMLDLYDRQHLTAQARLDRAAFELVRHSRDASPLVPDNFEVSVDLELEDSELAILTGSPYIQDGYWYIDGRNLGVQAEGITPHVGDNGNWHNGDTDTGQPAYLVPHYDQSTGEIYYIIPNN